MADLKCLYSSNYLVSLVMVFSVEQKQVLNTVQKCAVFVSSHSIAHFLQFVCYLDTEMCHFDILMHVSCCHTWSRGYCSWVCNVSKVHGNSLAQICLSKSHNSV